MINFQKGLGTLSKTAIIVSIRLLIYVVIIIVVFNMANVFYGLGHNIFYESSVDPKPGRDVMVHISEDYDTETVAKLLLAKGLINNETAFVVQSKFYGFTIKPGDYTLNTSQTTKNLLEKLNDGVVEESDDGK